MLLDILLVADLQAIQDRHQQLIDEAAHRHNAKRVDYDYRVNQFVLLSVPDPAKLEPCFVGPFRIHQVHVNGTLTIQRGNQRFERIIIRRVKPYRQ